MKTDIKDLMECYQRTVSDYTYKRQNWETENWRTRFNDWEGRDPSGKKLNSKDGKPPFPWLGASDAAPPIIDSYIREDVDMSMEALAGARVEVQPVEVSDMSDANSGTTVMHWLINSHMVGLEKEQELAANILYETGKVALGITWDRKVSLVPEVFDIEDFAQVEFVNQYGEPELASKVLLDPSREEEAIVLAQRLYQSEAAVRLGEALPELKKSIARDAVRELREKGSATIPMPTVSTNCPKIMAYRYGHDIFRPFDSMHIQEDSKIFVRHYTTEAELLNGEISCGWDPTWIQLVKEKTKGRVTAPNYSSSTNSTLRTSSAQYINGETWQRNTYEVVHAWERQTDDMGITKIVYTVFCPHLTHEHGEDIYAKSEVLTYSHGKYPFEDEAMELWSRNMSDSRGYGEVLGTAQRQIKVEWDSRVDRTSMTTLPPLLHPHGREPMSWGPGVKLPKGKKDDYSFMDIPSYDRVSEIVEASAYRSMNKWLGRADETADPVYASLRKQRLVKRWLGLWRRAFKQAYQLCQQFMDDEIYIRLTNDPYSKAKKIRRDDIQGSYDINVTFNALSFDNEVRKQNLEYLERVLSWDSQGVIDRAAAVTLGMQIIDPQMTRAIVRPQEAATQQEIEDTENVYAKIFAGLKQDVKPGQNYKLRRDVLNQIIFGQNEDGTPSNPAALQRLKTDEQFKSNLEHYSKQLDFQLQQQQNAIIGRRGA